MFGVGGGVVGGDEEGGEEVRGDEELVRGCGGEECFACACEEESERACVGGGLLLPLSLLLARSAFLPSDGPSR